MNRIPPFTFSLGTDIVFGIGSRSEIGRKARAFGTRAGLIASRTAFADSPFRAEIESAIGSAGVDIVMRREASGEPSLSEVVVTAQLLAAARLDLIVAVGGGSIMDHAKAAAVTAAVRGDISKMMTEPSLDVSGAVPVIAVPTTAGSGAEVSRGAIVLDPESQRKRGIRGAVVAARIAIVDPELTVTCPPRVTASAGFDAVAHAIETSVSLRAGPLAGLLSVEALRRLLIAVPQAMDDPGNLRARSSASFAALLMGINLANSTTCLPHRLQYPLGALTGTEHGVGVAALTPSWLARVARYAPQRLTPLAQAVRDDGYDADGPTEVTDAIDRFMRRIDLRPTLRDLGVQRYDLPELAARVEGSVEADPTPHDQASIQSLYEESF